MCEERALGGKGWFTLREKCWQSVARLSMRASTIEVGEGVPCRMDTYTTWHKHVHHDGTTRGIFIIIEFLGRFPL